MTRKTIFVTSLFAFLYNKPLMKGVYSKRKKKKKKKKKLLPLGANSFLSEKTPFQKKGKNLFDTPGSVSNHHKTHNWCLSKVRIRLF